MCCIVVVLLLVWKIEWGRVESLLRCLACARGRVLREGGREGGMGWELGNIIVYVCC